MSHPLQPQGPDMACNGPWPTLAPSMSQPSCWGCALFEDCALGEDHRDEDWLVGYGSQSPACDSATHSFMVQERSRGSKLAVDKADVKTVKSMRRSKLGSAAWPCL